MKRLLLLAVIAAGALATVSAAATHRPDLTFTLFGRNLEAAFNDTGTAGTSQGDVRVINRELFNPRGQRVGRVTVTCIVTEIGDDPKEKGMANCDTVFRYAGG